jgi:hypothetical protein
MIPALTRAILDLAESAGPGGIAMGTIVDVLDTQGHPIEAVEAEIWELLARRRLTPCGYIRRTVRSRADGSPDKRVRVYEFMLMPWSLHLDAQLELELER